jgi:hypothetical protein
MLRLPALLVSALLLGCDAGKLTRECAWGAEHPDGAYACAVRNFGQEAADEMYRRAAYCETICDGHEAAPECAVNCP